jgi:c-di-GMP-binding flagellar brake protein YcgR
MDRRVEARFQVYSSAKLILLDDPEREDLDCLLVDISGSGMKLVSDVELAEGQMIRAVYAPCLIAKDSG